jgi:iron complex outermembrane receptor protein
MFMGESKSEGLKPSLLSVAIAAALNAMVSGAISTGAYAQEIGDEILVTGSRIIRRDNVSNSPIVTIDAEQFEAQAGLNFESYLNQLPNYNPASTPTTGQIDVQITPVNSVGIASISLRGFGPNRSLVLIDGRRAVPINALMVTDINSVPSALIERVETITGGASAVYGADALGGVTNFILRDNFEGFDLDAQFGTTDEGGGEESRIGAVFGANFDDGRGNIAMGVEAYNRESVLEIDRDTYTDRYLDPNAEGTFGFLQGTTHYNCLFNCPSVPAITGIFGGVPFNPAGANVFRQYNLNADARTLWAGSNNNWSALGSNRYNGGPNFTFFPANAFNVLVPGNNTTVNDEGFKWHNNKALVSAPQERYSFFASGNYDFNDRVSFFSRATMAESETRTVLFGTNAIFGWEGLVQYNPATDSPINPALNYQDAAVVAAAIANPTNPAYANPGFIGTGLAGAQHPVPVELAALLNSRPVQAGDWQPGWSPDSSLPPRSTVNTNTVWQLEAGIEFQLFDEWDGELYLSHGQSSTYNNAFGNLSLTRYRNLIRLPDYGRNARVSGNQTGASPGFGAADITCATGFYDTFFRGDMPLSNDCFQAINATLQTRAQNVQDIVELNFQGILAEMPAGELRMAAGYQSRENSGTFVPDILQSTVSFTDQVVGVYPTGYLDASTSVDDAYVELLVPLLADKRGAQRLELEIGARSSDYEHTDKEETYKFLVNWELNDSVRFRGGFNRATRAPNLGELFLATQEVFTIGGNNFGDPCGVRSTSPFGAGGTGTDPVLVAGEINPLGVYAGGQTPQGAASTRLICEALMGATGANQFYNVTNAAAGGGAAFNWVNQQGNSQLVSETADSVTFGAVLASPFERPWLRNATLSLDYYRIEIEDAITLYSVDYANFRCYGAQAVTTPAEAAARAASPECQLVPRNLALGGPLTTAISYDNQATIETAGADITLNWMLPFSELGSGRQGGIAVNLMANVLDYYRTKQSPASFDVETEWKGSLGPNLSGTNGGAFDYRLFGTFTYFRNDWSVNLRWRYLPGVFTAQYASLQAVIENNAKVAAGGSGVILSYTPSSIGGNSRDARATEIETDSYSIFDMSFNYDITETLSLRGGITNLLDTEPVEIGSMTGYAPGTNLAGICGGAPGCVAPTGPTLPLTGPFNVGNSGGYYDTIGRRFFVGFDLRF